MGTRFEFALVCGEHDGRAIGEAAMEVVTDLHARWSAFSPDSLVTFINRHAAERAVRLDRDTFEVLRCALDVWRDSDGAFDITVGPLMRAHGFRDATRSEEAIAHAPVGSDAIELDERSCSIRFTRPGIAIDLGAIAKGHALDAAAAIVKAHGVEAAILHGGTSTVVAMGSPPGLDSWRVALGKSSDAPVVCLRDAAMSVSSPHGRGVREMDGSTAGHVIDPRSRRSAFAADLAAVIGSSAREADAWSTAVLVLGERTPCVPAGLTTVIRRAASGRIGYRVGGPAKQGIVIRDSDDGV